MNKPEEAGRMTDDARLLERAGAGDRGAFDSIVEKYHRQIYFLALRMVKNQEDAEELTQQTFVKAFRKLDTFKGDASFKTWLYQVGINSCRSFLRAKKDVLELNEEVATGAESTPDPLGRLIKGETARAAAKMIEELPEKQRIIVTLRVFHEMSYAEIGKAAECSEQTAKVNFHYGIENLRKRLKENGTL